MLLRIKLAAFASIIITSGAAETTQTVVEPPSSELLGLDNANDAADAPDRELYGGERTDVLRTTRCADDNWCETEDQCENSEAAVNMGYNGAITDNNRDCVGGCIVKNVIGGKVSWVKPTQGTTYKTFKTCTRDNFERVCCNPEDPTESPTESPTTSPTTSPTWMEDGWGGDKWDGGSSSYNKWGWSEPSSSGSKWDGGSSSYNRWGWSEPSSSGSQWDGGKNQWSNNNFGGDWGNFEP